MKLIKYYIAQLQLAEHIYPICYLYSPLWGNEKSLAIQPSKPTLLYTLNHYVLLFHTLTNNTLLSLTN